MTKPIEKAVQIAGGQSALAARLSVSVQAVNQWVKGTRPVPGGRCLAIEKATGGSVSAIELRPDVFDPKENDAAA